VVKITAKFKMKVIDMKYRMLKPDPLSLFLAEISTRTVNVIPKMIRKISIKYKKVPTGYSEGANGGLTFVEP